MKLISAASQLLLFPSLDGFSYYSLLLPLSYRLTEVNCQAHSWKKPTFFWLRGLFEYEILCWKYSDDLWEISAASFCNFSLKRATSFVLSPCLIITLSCQTVQGSWHTYEWLGELLQARYVHPVRSLNSCICGLYQLAVLVVTLFSLLNQSSSLSTATNL